MRIALVTSQFPVAGEPTRGRPLLQTARELARLATVRVISPIAEYPRWAQPRSYLAKDFDPAFRVEGCDTEYVRYTALPGLTRPFNGWLCGRTVTAPVARFRADVVLAYWLYPDAYGAASAARRLGLPLVAGARGSDIRVRDAISRRLTRRAIARAARLLVVSDDLGRLAVRDYAAQPARVRVIRNGCDAAVFRPGERDSARRALGLDPATTLITYVGRLVPEKGLGELLDAQRLLAQCGRTPRLVLVGDGPFEAELRRRAAAAPGLPVTFAGRLAPAEVAQWLVACDLLALPSYSEGHPNVLVEAMACGRPVVATTVGGIPEVVDADAGVLVPPRDAAALAGAIATVLERRWDEAAIAARNSRDWASVAQETLRACAEALAEARGDRALATET